MKDIKISIVVAIYNGASTLPRCLDSIFAQSWKNIEVICVNDCSPDNSLEVIQEYASRFSNLRMINHTENKNGGGADNTGIKAATGDYICIVDQDDALCPGALETLVKNCHDGKDDIVLGQWYSIDAEGRKTLHQNGVLGCDKRANVNYTLEHGVRILGSLFKPSLYSQNDLYYPENVGFADNGIYNAIMIDAKSINVIDYIVYDYYEAVPNSLSKIISVKGIKDRIFTTDLMYANCTRMDVNHEYEEAIRFRYLDLTTYTIVLLGLYPLSEVKDMATHVSNKIGTYWSDEYRSKFNEHDLRLLSDPIGYIKCENNRRRKMKIKSFFHSIRHSIVVVVKRILGMNPNKSIYNEKK